MHAPLQKSQNSTGKIASYFTKADNAVSATKDDAQKMASPESAVDFNFSNILVQPINIPPAIQTKLSVNTPEDKYEQEADDIADKVMETPGPVSVQRRYDGYEQERRPQRNKNGISPLVSEAVYQTLQSPGHPMDAATQSLMGKRFGCDFGNVRIHSDQLAQRSANDINALAYTSGNNIAFNTGRYSPRSDSGKKLLAHELTHVVQQAGTSHTNTIARIIQRQQPPAPVQPAASPALVTQQLYDQAMASIAKQKGVNPIILSILKKGKVGQVVPGVYSVASELKVVPPKPAPAAGSKPAPSGSSAPVPAPSGSSAPAPASAPASVVSLVFNLEISPVTQLPSGGVAAFLDDAINQTSYAGDPTTGESFTRLLKILTKVPTDADAADSLGENLVHEGTHMLIAVDNFIASLNPSNSSADKNFSAAITGTQKSFENYTSAAAGSSKKLLEAEVNRVLTLAGPTIQPQDPKKVVDQVIKKLVEERFSIDQQVAAYPLRATQSRKSNASLVDGYIFYLLSQETTINPYPEPLDLKAKADLKTEMVNLLDAVTAKVNPPPQPATPAPGATTPPAGSAAPQKKP